MYATSGLNVSGPKRSCPDMPTPIIFTHFVRDNGRKLSEVNPGSDEFALTPLHAKVAIDFLSGSQVAVWGGDVMSDADGKLTYVHENWHCERLSGEDPAIFIRRSHAQARVFIEGLAKRGDPSLFVVLVCSEPAR